MNQVLEELRKLRNFQAEDYLKIKVTAINNFFRKNNLDAAVVGLSGGVDSAVTILLLKKASEAENSPIKKILGVIAPIVSHGTTGQKSASERAIDLAVAHNLDYKIVDLTRASDEIILESKDKFNNAWAEGQMASVLRTPLFYYHAALLQNQGYKSLVVGTTNRDEGSYIGFFGKASDAMVDLQIISDIHKSEVYQLAHLLGVTEEIIHEKPKGDVYDGKVDEEMIGAPYWFLEMYLLLKENNDDNVSIFFENEYPQKRLEEIAKFRRNWKYFVLTKEEEILYKKYSENIEAIHLKNAHKYQVGNPAHFIDVKSRKIQGGWQ